MYAGIMLHTLIWAAACMIVFLCYSRFRNTASLSGGTITGCPGAKLPLLYMVLISVLFTLFNVYATTTSVSMGGDRSNYYASFLGYLPAGSVGLNILFKIAHAIGMDYFGVLYFTTFFCTFVTLIAYRLSKDAKPFAFYLLCLTQYFLTTLTALKQAYTSAFAVLFFVLTIEYDTKTSRFFSLVLAVLACAFHSTGYVLIIIVIAKRIVKTTKTLLLYFGVLLLVGLFFKDIILTAATLIEPFLPYVAGKIFVYIGDSAYARSSGSPLAFIMGAPYYLITLLGLRKREMAKPVIKNYDDYLFVVGTGAFIYLLSMYNAWLSRFVYLFSFVSFVFFGELLKTFQLETNRKIYSLLVQGSLALITYRFLFMVYSLYGGF